jgi:hypothetical protein
MQLGEECMLWIYADRYGLELARRRRTFKAASFSRALADNGRSGIVTLHPETTALRVGSDPDDYSCVRIFNDDGTVIGTMKRSPAGEVAWHGAIRL